MLGLIGFGGVLPLARSMLVEQRRWLTAEQFTELLGLCQFLPGGNVINLSRGGGDGVSRAAWCAMCFAGADLRPTAIVVGLGVIYARYQDGCPCATRVRRVGRSGGGFVALYRVENVVATVGGNGCR
ncbi:chromate transporter, chromate ion transporter (CHR) family [Serratia fonticola]|uniref:Chromate transporter, chromate ion transporter (CHR) family n=1 Tax=Serratia fonticola TaxID=47917 RepID=A0A4U9VWD0_SERFO|nr:chromate transporter, chromate ion transporter (CHR) family [Serratia fonticola]